MVDGTRSMGDAVGVGLGPPKRRWSLRSEWSRAFTIMVLLWLVTGASTVVGVHQVVADVAGSGLQLQRESRTVSTLLADLVDHEQTGHKLLLAQPADLSAYIRQQQQILTQFDEAATVFPTTNGMRATIVKAQQSWENALMTYGLWGDQVQALHGKEPAQSLAFAASSDDTRSLLDGLRSASLATMDAGLAHGAKLERILIATLSVLFLLGLAATVYFRRRMGRDLLRPMASIRACLLRLQAGDAGSRFEVARHDELGELAEAFNRMAEIVHSTHRTLALRATHDSLTGLANRPTLTARLTASFRSGSERRARQESLLLIDLDDFKAANDALGHEGGDALLVQLATRFNRCVRGQDLVARLGGDQFAILVMEDESSSVALEVADRVLDSLREPFIIGGESVAVTASIGVAQRGSETQDASELLRQADFAMYMAKGAGRSCHQLFDPELYVQMVERSALTTNLAAAVSEGQLRLQYQPIADLHTGEIIGVEALVRWQHPTLGLLSPETFIPLAEQSGDIDAIGCWVLYTATRQVASWRKTMDHCNNMWVSVNLSALQLANPKSLAAIQHILADPMAETDKVVLEVTETALSGDVPDGIALLSALKGLGVRVAADDFGTGFSSLSALVDLPVDILKIDGSFISGNASSAVMPSVPLLEGILRLANNLSLEVIAEGIEGQDQLDLLRKLGCRMGQGYHLAWPTTAHALEAMLASGGLLQLGPSAEVGGSGGS